MIQISSELGWRTACTFCIPLVHVSFVWWIDIRKMILFLTFKQSHINTSKLLSGNHIFNKYENIDWSQFSQYPQSLGSCKIYNFWEKLPWPFHQVVWCLRWWWCQFDLLVYTLNNRFSNHLSYYLTMIDLELFILHNLMKWVCISTAYNTPWGLKQFFKALPPPLCLFIFWPEYFSHFFHLSLLF